MKVLKEDKKNSFAIDKSKYGIKELDEHQGEYFNGVYVPILDKDGTPFLPKEMFDGWE